MKNRSRADRIQGQSRFGGILVVRCRLNGNYHGRFLVDTGAAITAITPVVAASLDLDLQETSHQQTVISVNQTVQVPSVMLETFQVGPHEITHLEVTVLPLATRLQIDGLLGVNVLRRFRATFEFDQATLILR